MPQIPVISAAEFAVADAAVKTALQLVTPLVHYAPSTGTMQHSAQAKIAAAADSISKLAGLLEELRAKHTDTVKAAHALVDAVKLAEDGLIDIADVLEHAGPLREVKVSEVGRLVSEPDKTAESELPARQARGSDALTAFLRR